MDDLAKSNTQQIDLSGKVTESRLVGLAFVCFLLVGGLFLASVTAQILGAFRQTDVRLFDVLSISTLIGFVLSAVICIVCYTNRKIYGASMNVATELKRVTWPSGKEVQVSTIAVIVVSLISAVILLCYDFLSAKIMSTWIPWAIRHIVGS